MDINSIFNKFDNIKSNYILKRILNNLQTKKLLIINKYNKKIQQRLDISFQDYKNCCQIEIEIIPIKNKFGPPINFINIDKDDEERYYHIYFNNIKEETNKKYLFYNEKIDKIRIIIDYQIISFYKLFYDCKCNYSISFKRFNRNNIINMNKMFSRCLSLKKIDFSNFNTNNVTDMGSMFSGCSSLEEINLINFNTTNVTNMSCMFFG